MNKTTNKKLKINVKGTIRAWIYNFFAQRHAKKHGVHTHSISYSKREVEVVMEGSNASLWRMLNWNKRGPIFCNVEEVKFQFIDL